MPQKVTAAKPAPDFSLMTSEDTPPSQSQSQTYSVAEFAKLLKAQYPQVSAIPDDQLVGQYLQKYPQYKLRVKMNVPRGTSGPESASKGLAAASGRRTAALEAAGTAVKPITVAGSVAPVLGQAQQAGETALESEAQAENDPQIADLEKTDPAAAARLRRGKYLKALPALGAAAAAGGEGRFGFSVLRALLGGMAGRATEETGKAAVGSPEAPQSTGELLEDVGESGAEQGLNEVAGRAISYPIRRVATGVMNRKSKALTEVIGDRYGVHFTPGQTSQKTIPAALERRAEYNPFAREIVEKGRTAQKESAGKAVEGLIDWTLGTTPANIGGKRTQAAITDIGSPIFKREVDRLQSILNARTLKTRVNVIAMKAEAQHELNQALHLIRSGQGGAPLTTAAPSAGRLAILQDIVKLPDAVPFSTLMQLRTKWMGIGPQMTELLSNDAKGAAKHYVQQATGALDDTLRGTPAMVDWLKFRNFTRKGAEVFESDAIVRALNGEPEKIVQQVGPKDITNALRMRRSVIAYAEKYGNQDQIREAQRGWRNFQNTYVRDQILGPLHGDMTQLSQRLKEFKPQVLNTIFSDARSRTMLSQLREIGQAMERINPDVRVMHGHEVMTLRAYLGAAGAVPIAKIAYSPRATRFYLRGLAGLAEASKHAPLRAGGKIISGSAPYLGRALADIIRAQQVIGQYQEAFPAPAGESFKEAEEGGGEQ